jgi:O-methyltransferase domain/Dimerisation domain
MISQGAAMSPRAQSWQDFIPPFVRLWQLLEGYQVAQALAVASKLGLPQLLEGGAKDASELARSTGTHAPSLYRLLRALASVGVFTETGPAQFSLTPLGGNLGAGPPGPPPAYAALLTERSIWQPWSELLYSVTTGKPAFDRVFGTDFWQYHATHPEAGATFNAALASTAVGRPAALLANYDFSKIRTFVDVGGGHGVMLAGILQAHAAMHGVLVEQPHVLAKAKDVMKSSGVAERCTFLERDIFASIPVGGDAYLLSLVLHTMDDERAKVVLRNCHKAMSRSAKLLLFETIVPPGNDPDPSKFLDLRMLVLSGGRERTNSEFEALCAAASFHVSKIVRLENVGPFSLIEAVPIE